MENINATVNTFLDKRRSNGENKYPVKITIYFAGDKKRYNTGIAMSEDEWKKIGSSNLRDDTLKMAKRKIEAKRKKAEDIIEKMESFTFSEFESLYFEESIIRKSSKITDLFNEYIEALDKQDRIGTSMSYKTTLNSFLKFRGNIKITEITSNYLSEYEKYMIVTQGNSPSTVGIYLRQLRRIINVAIKNGIFPMQKYPFKGYSIPSSRNIKKALTSEQIKSLFAYQTEDEKIRMGVDFWLFSYLSNGMNVADICHLKKNSIQGEFFSFFRTKTKNTKKKDLRPIKVPLLPKSWEIINQWKNTDSKSPYLFPVLEEGLTARQVKFRIQDFVKMINTQMKKVASDLKITVGVGTYVARHTHSTILKRKGVSTDVIRENLGHSSLLTTESYLDDFTDDFKIENAKKLMDF